MMPSFTSGRPSRVLGSLLMTRYQQARASSSPPPRQDRLALAAQRFTLRRVGDVPDLGDVRAGDEPVGLAAPDHEGLDPTVGHKLVEQRVQLAHDRRGKFVHLLAGEVEGQDGDAVGPLIHMERVHLLFPFASVARRNTGIL
jgi:hypothetical protein